MILVLNTQVRENYGAHDWNGEGECPEYWKSKGGNTYVVRGVTSVNCGGLSLKLQREVCSDDEYFQEYGIGGGFYLESENPLDWMPEWEWEYVRYYEIIEGKIIRC